jgi:glucosamine--fructose-6-phosphate aminotransferase (isomerizing)
MCGIVGAVAERNITAILIEGLKRLEYRGYDSAGLAVSPRRQAAARVVSARSASWKRPLLPSRWSAAGYRPHPLGHPRCADRRQRPPAFSGDVAVVHNGIIENHEELRENSRAWVTCSPRRPTPKSSPTCSPHPQEQPT